MTTAMTNPIKNDALERRRRKQRIVEQHTEKEYYCCGKKVNKNVWELQQIYESTQAKTTQVLPEFLERIRYMIVNGIRKATFSKSVDQNGELFSHVMETLLSKIVPKVDPETKQLTTVYDRTKNNIGGYILTTCYWSVIDWQKADTWNKSLLSCSEFLEDYDKASEKQISPELTQLKFIKNFDEGNTYVPVIQQLLQGGDNEDED